MRIWKLRSTSTKSSSLQSHQWMDSLILKWKSLLQPTGSPSPVLPGVLISSAAIWGGYALFNYVIMLALRLSHLPFSAAALVLCTTGFSMIVPSSPGGIGPFEWAGVQALALFGVTESVGFGYTLGLHLFTILSMDLFGLVGLAVEGVNYADVRREADEQDTAQAAAAE